MTAQDLLKLCTECESTWLDFKSSQYRFTKDSSSHSKDGKAEFIKDVLAFANTNRTKTAYILIGVKDPARTSHPLVGIPKKLAIDDASLQQMVCEKTNVRIPFQSSVVRLDNSSRRVVQVVAIPPCFDKIPFYLKNKFEAIKPMEVWFRQGSSNTRATPEDLIRFGRELEQSNDKPDVRYQLVSPNAVNETNRLVTFRLIPRRIPLTSTAIDGVFRHRREVALSLVKLSVSIKNQSLRSSAKIKVQLSLEETQPWTGKLVDTTALFSRDPFALWSVDCRKVETSVELYPGEAKTDVCPIVFDTNGTGRAKIHVLISVDGQGVLADKTTCYEIEQRDYRHDFSDFVKTLLLWQDEKDTFDWIHQQVNTKPQKAPGK